VRIGIGRCRLTQGVTLGKTARFGAATLLFLDLSKQQAKATLVQPFGVRGLDLMPGFAGQSGIERDLC
jgi:hypothetical protein